MGSLAWPLTGPQAQQSVPASTQSGSDPIIDRLIQVINKPYANFQAATTPIVGPHTGQVPSNLQTPIQPHQNSPMVTGAVGKKAARAQGISNAIIGATNALGSVVTAEAQVKQNQIKDASVKVLTAQQTIDESQQQHDQALENLKKSQPGTPEAEQFQKQVETFQKNIDDAKKARDGVFSDPKMKKALVKGFDISYTDPTSNKTPEHEAVQAAFKQVQAAKDAKEKQEAIAKYRQAQGAEAGALYASQQPRGLAGNAQAQQRLALEQSQSAAAQTTLKTYLESKDKEAERQIQLEKAYIEQQTELQKQQAQIRNQDDQRAKSFAQRKEIVGIENYNATKRLYTEANLAFRRDKAVLEMRNADPTEVFKSAESSARDWSSREESAQGRLDKAENDLAALGKAPGDPLYDRAQKIVDQAQEDLEMVQDKSDYALNAYNSKLSQLGMQPIPGPKVPEQKGSPNGSSSSSSGSSSTINGAPAPTGSAFTDYLGK